VKPSIAHELPHEPEAIEIVQQGDITMNPTVLTDVFQEAIECFNDPSRHGRPPYDALGDLLHIDIEMGEVDGPQNVHVPKTNVLPYLKNKQAPLLPQFHQDTSQRYVAGQNRGKRGVIAGIGTYQDSKAQNKPTYQVVYTFIFERDNNNNWLIKRGFAVPL
jgi:hypothetical protein